MRQQPFFAAFLACWFGVFRVIDDDLVIDLYHNILSINDDMIVKPFVIIDRRFIEIANVDKASRVARVFGKRSVDLCFVAFFYTTRPSIFGMEKDARISG